MSNYDFSTLITALDTKAQAIAADSGTSAKDLIYLGKAIEAINGGGGGLQPDQNLSDVANAATARLNLGFDGTGITNGQLMVWNASLNKFAAGSISAATVSQSNPDGTETGRGYVYQLRYRRDIYCESHFPSDLMAGHFGNQRQRPSRPGDIFSAKNIRSES